MARGRSSRFGTAPEAIHHEVQELLNLGVISAGLVLHIEDHLLVLGSDPGANGR